MTLQHGIVDVPLWFLLAARSPELQEGLDGEAGAGAGEVCSTRADRSVLHQPSLTQHVGTRDELQISFVFFLSVEEVLVCVVGRQPQVLQGLHR